MGFRVQVQSTSIGMPRGSMCEGVCVAAGVAAEGRDGPMSGGRRMECVGEWDVSSVGVQSEWGDVWRQDRKPHL
jgi:hypothetical protein